jgi:hypothetical protein
MKCPKKNQPTQKKQKVALKSKKAEKAFMLTLISIITLALIPQSFADPNAPAVILSTGAISTLPSVTIDINSLSTIGTNDLSLGFNLHHDYERSTWSSSPTLRQLGVDMNARMIRVFTHTIEPCSSWNDETKTGTFNWQNVDSFIERIFDTGAQPLITIGFVDSSSTLIPPSMDINPNTGLPYPDSFAAYCREWVRHFQQAGLPVKYYEVLNEAWYYFYPNWNWNQAKAQNFLTLYNTCYDAMHNQNNQILVGNDASLHRRFLDFWKANGGKLDLLSFHKYDCDNLAMGDNTPLSRAENRYYVSDSYYYGVNDARQLWGSNLPAIASETNWAAFCSQGTDPRLQQVVGSVWLALSLRSAILENVQYNIYYSFSSSKSWEETNKATGGFGFGMINQDDNEPWYPYYVQYMIGHNLAVGDPLLETSSSSSDVRVLSWIHEDTQNTLITCKVDEPRIITIRGLSGQLNLFKIDDNVPYTAPSIQSEQLDANNALIIDGYTVILLQTTVE